MKYTFTYTPYTRLHRDFEGQDIPENYQWIEHKHLYDQESNHPRPKKNRNSDDFSTVYNSSNWQQ
jgi:hypothetical protein